MNFLLLGQIQMSASYDVRNLNNARAEFKYERGSDFFNLNLNQNRTPNELHTVIDISSSSISLPLAKMEVNANFRDSIDLNVEFTLSDKKIALSLNIAENIVIGEITTPFSGFEKISGRLSYDIYSRNSKSVTLSYARGQEIIEMEIQLNIRGNRRGSLSLSLETPFEIARTLTLETNWRNGRGSVIYTRNGITYRLEGTVNITAEDTTVEIIFSPDSGEAFNLRLNFNLGSILSGDGIRTEELAKAELVIFGKRIGFRLEGFRGAHKLYLAFKAESTFHQIQELQFKLNSEMSLQKIALDVEGKLNEHYLKIKNKYEAEHLKFWLTSEMESSLSSLPHLMVRFGNENRVTTLHVKYNEREVILTFAWNDNMTEGFLGTVSLPHMGFTDVSYDVKYHFSNPDEIKVDIELELEPGKPINVDVIYNSDGIQARFFSPDSSHHIRARRSLDASSFSAEVGLDDYSASVRGDLLDADSKRGIHIEGEFLGQRISVDSHLQIGAAGYREGKLMFETNIVGYERFGGDFTYSNENSLVSAKAQIVIPSETHFIEAVYDTTSQMAIKISVLTSSSLLNGRHTIDIESNRIFEFVNQNANDGNISLLYSGITSINTVLTLDRADALKASMKIILPNASYVLEGMLKMPLDNSEFSILFKCPNGEQNLKASLIIDDSTHEKKLIKVHLLLSSYLLSSNFEYNLNGDIETTKSSLEQIIHFKNTMHILKFGYDSSSSGAKMIIHLETPLLEINKILISTEIMSAPTIKANVLIDWLGKSHSIELEMNKLDKRIICIFKSPYINGQVIRVDGYIIGESSRDSDIVGNLTFAGQSYGLKMHLMFVSLNNASAEVEVKTPLSGYRKMNFHLSFKHENHLEIIFRADSPIVLTFELTSGLTSQNYTWTININSSVIGFEKIMVVAEFPLYKHGGKIMLSLPNSVYGFEFEFSDEIYSKLINFNVLINGQNYGAGGSIRYKAPYELAFFVSAPDNKNKFHIAMDPTFLNWYLFKLW